MRARRPISRSGKQRGNALLELALFSTALFLLLFGVADFARIFHSSEIVSGAARAGAQFGLVSAADSADLAGMKQAALNNAPAGAGMQANAERYCLCPTTGKRVSCTETCETGAPNGYIHVTTEMPFETLIRWPGIPGSQKLTGSAILRVY